MREAASQRVSQSASQRASKSAVAQEQIDGLRERGTAEGGKLGGMPGPGNLKTQLAFNENRPHAQAAAEFHVDEGVANHDALRSGETRKPGRSLQEETGKRLAAVAAAGVVRADEEGVDVSAAGGEELLEGLVDGGDLGGGIKSEGDAALVGDDNYRKVGAVEAQNSLSDSGQDVEIVPG